MVTAMTAEISRDGWVIRDGAGKPVRARRMNLTDPAEKHGVNLDDADESIEGAGFVLGRPIWHEDRGGFYKAVVAPESAFRRAKPAYSEESMAEWRRSPEGRAHAAAMGRHRAR
jgi:hypothetical protein